MTDLEWVILGESNDVVDIAWYKFPQWNDEGLIRNALAHYLVTALPRKALAKGCHPQPFKKRWIVQTAHQGGAFQ